MKKFFNKAKDTFDDPSFSTHQQTSPPQPSTISPPTTQDLLRYRYHHGTNLGSIFLLEKWLHGSMFPQSSTGDSELHAVTATLHESSLHATRQKFESHWRAALMDQDLTWLVNEAKCTSIRLPIGYFTLGLAFCRGTPFESVAEVYVNAWGAVKDLVARTSAYGIGVLIDMHALPGGANADAHSGSGTGKADFWTSRSARKLGTAALVHVVREVAQDSRLWNVIGIQLCNEAAWGAKGMYEWYSEVIEEIGRVDGGIPIYISDAWDLNKALEWTNGRRVLKGEAGAPRNPVVVDTHMYYTFDEKHTSKAPQEIISSIPSELRQLDGKSGDVSSRGEAQIMVGEWSCVLDTKTWARVQPDEKNALVRAFAQVQSKKWQEAAGGAFFWTLKMDWMHGGEWGFMEQVKQGNISPPAFLTLEPQEVRRRIEHARSQRMSMAAEALRTHEEYWNRTCPGKSFEHGLYGEGWEVGFSDALGFFGMRADGGLGDGNAGGGGDKIGCLEIWVKKRLLENGNRGEFVWEWEQGLRAGIGAFYRCVDI